MRYGLVCRHSRTVSESRDKDDEACPCHVPGAAADRQRVQKPHIQGRS